MELYQYIAYKSSIEDLGEILHRALPKLNNTKLRKSSVLLKFLFTLYCSLLLPTAASCLLIIYFLMPSNYIFYTSCKQYRSSTNFIINHQRALYKTCKSYRVSPFYLVKFTAFLTLYRRKKEDGYSFNNF